MDVAETINFKRMNAVVCDIYINTVIQKKKKYRMKSESGLCGSFGGGHLRLDFMGEHGFVNVECFGLVLAVGLVSGRSRSSFLFWGRDQMNKVKNII